MDLHTDHEGPFQETIQEVQPEEVLVISLGTGPQLTPGMMSENEVFNLWPSILRHLNSSN